MKMNSKKIIVSTLALVMGAALAGSISGTVAWYQYSTRAQAEFQGVTAHCTSQLQIRINAANEATYPWANDLLPSQVNTYLQTAAPGGAERGAETYNTLRPVTESGALAAGEVATSLVKNPREGVTSPEDWGAASKVYVESPLSYPDYIDLPLEIRNRDVNGGSDAFLATKVYITDLTLAASSTNTKADVSEALRVGVAAKQDADPVFGTDDYATFAKGEAAATVTTTTAGVLALGDGTNLDKTGYSFQQRETYLYGVGATGTKASYAELVDGYFRDGTTLYSLAASTHALTEVTPAPTVYADIAERDAVAHEANDLCYVTSENEFFKCTAAGTPGTWAVLSYQKPAAGGYYKFGEDLYKYADGSFSAYDLPASVYTSTKKVTSAANGIATVNADGSFLGNEIGALDTDKTLHVTLRIYLQGWQEIGGKTVWSTANDATGTIGARFDLGITFETEVHADHA